MKPEEVAALLFDQFEQPHFPSLILDLESQLTIPTLIAAFRILAVEQRRDPQKAWQQIGILEAIAAVIQTEEADSLVDWARGSVSLILNHDREALTYFENVEQFYRREGKTLQMVGIIINRITALRNLGEYPEALKLAQTARAHCLDLGKEAEGYLAVLEDTIAWIYQEMGDIEAALAAHDNSRRLYKKQGDKASVAMVDTHQAFVLQSIDRFQEAQTLLERARPVFMQENYLEMLARTDMNLGTIAHKRGLYQTALHHLEAAYASYEAISLPIEMAIINLERGFVYRDLHLIQEMMTLTGAAEKVLRREKFQREHTSCLMNLAIGYQRLGQPDMAEKLLVRARRKLYRQGARWKLWLVDTDRAELKLITDQVASANRLARRTLNQVDPRRHPSLAARLNLLLARCALAGSPPDLKTAVYHTQQALDLTKTVHLPKISKQAHHLLAKIQEKSGDLPAGWRQMKQAVLESEQLRAFLSFDELHIGFMEDSLPIYDDYVHLTHKLLYQKIITAPQLLYALNLAQTAPLPPAANNRSPSPETDSDLETRLNALREQWHWYQTKIELPATDDEPRELTDHQKLETLELEIAELIRRHQARSFVDETLNQTLPDFQTVESWSEALQKQLAPEEILLQYYLADNQVHVMLLTPDTIEVDFDLSAETTVWRTLRAWHFHIERIVQNRARADIKKSQTYLRRFYQLLVQPIAPYLETFQHIYLILAPEWHSLPFSAFFDGQTYLTNRCTITRLSSAELLAEVRTKRYSYQPTEASRQALVLGQSLADQLPYTIKEANEITAILEGQQWQVVKLLEEAATSTAVQQAASACHLLHVASHATFRADNPLFSWIQLAEERLTVNDLYRLQLSKNPLVILSACETGRGQPRGGGLLGMGRGFLTAGASGLLLTLWRIEDKSSLRLMANFYQALQVVTEGSAMTVAHTLQAAKIKAVEQELDPFYWAGFIYLAG